jgi:hypothetical protein
MSTGENDYGFFGFFVIPLMFLFVGVLPSVFSTYTTKDKTVSKSKYEVVSGNNIHMSYVIIDVDKDEPVTIEVTNSYLLDRIKNGKIKVVKTEHLNIFNGSSGDKDEYRVEAIK